MFCNTHHGLQPDSGDNGDDEGTNEDDVEDDGEEDDGEEDDEGKGEGQGKGKGKGNNLIEILIPVIASIIVVAVVIGVILVISLYFWWQKQKKFFLRQLTISKKNSDISQHGSRDEEVLNDGFSNALNNPRQGVLVSQSSESEVSCLF